MKNKLPSYAKLVEVTRALSMLVLELREDSARRDKLSIQNSISRTLAADSNAQVKFAEAVVDDALYGESVTGYNARVQAAPPTRADLDEARQMIQKSIASLGHEIEHAISTRDRDRPEPGEDTERMWAQDDEAAASCHLVADNLERNSSKFGNVWPKHIQNLRHAAARLRHEV